MNTHDIIVQISCRFLGYSKYTFLLALGCFSVKEISKTVILEEEFFMFQNQYQTKLFKFLVLLYKCTTLVDRTPHVKKIEIKNSTILDNYSINSLSITLRMFFKAF